MVLCPLFDPRFRANIELLDLGASPRRFPQKREARFDARVEQEAANGDFPPERFPTESRHEFR